MSENTPLLAGVEGGLPSPNVIQDHVSAVIC